MIPYLAGRSTIEQPFGTFNFYDFNGGEIVGVLCSFGFGDKEDVLDSFFFHGNGPVGVYCPTGGWVSGSCVAVWQTLPPRRPYRDRV